MRTKNKPKKKNNRHQNTSKPPTPPEIKVSQAKTNHTTRFGGSAVLIRYLNGVLRFRQRFAIVTIKKGKNSTFSTVDMLFALLAITMLGCDRIFRINDRFKNDELLAKQLGLVRMFDQSTANRFLKKVTRWNLRQLERILNELIEKHGQFDKPSPNELDVDASDLTRSSHNTEGAKPGRNKKNKGKDSYQISCGFANHQVVATQMTSGNVHCSKALKPIFNKTLAVMDRIDLIRIDAGYASIETLKWLKKLTVSKLSEVAIKFLMACSNQAKGVQNAIAYAKKHPEQWVQVKKGEKDISVMDFKNTQLFEKDPNSQVRLILVKMVQKVKKCKDNKVRYHHKTRIYAIATNLTQGYSAKKIFKKYHRRQTIELMFREMKNSFYLGKLPTGKKNANYAYFLMCCLAYNASYYFKRDALPKKFRHKVMATIRCLFLEITACWEDAWEIEFDQNYKNYIIYTKIVSKVKRLVCSVNQAQATA